MLLYVFSRFQNSITLARNNIFSCQKKFLVAAIRIFQKIENRPQTPPTTVPLPPPSPSPPPRPLNKGTDMGHYAIILLKL